MLTIGDVMDVASFEKDCISKEASYKRQFVLSQESKDLNTSPGDQQ